MAETKEDKLIRENEELIAKIEELQQENEALNQQNDELQEELEKLSGKKTKDNIITIGKVDYKVLIPKGRLGLREFNTVELEENAELAKEILAIKGQKFVEPIKQK